MSDERETEPPGRPEGLRPGAAGHGPEAVKSRVLSPRTARWATAVIALAVAGAIVIPSLTTEQKPTPDLRSPLQKTDRVNGIVLQPLGTRDPVEFDSFRGRPIVLNAFASTCAPCIEEMPRFQKLHSTLGDKVAFVGIAVNDYGPEALELVRKTGVTFPVGADPRGEVYLAIGGLRMPTTWFIDKEGKILEVFPGEISEGELRSRIRQHFAI